MTSSSTLAQIDAIFTGGVTPSKDAISSACATLEKSARAGALWAPGEDNDRAAAALARLVERAVASDGVLARGSTYAEDEAAAARGALPRVLRALGASALPPGHASAVLAALEASLPAHFGTPFGSVPVPLWEDLILAAGRGKGWGKLTGNDVLEAVGADVGGALAVVGALVRRSRSEADGAAILAACCRCLRGMTEPSTFFRAVDRAAGLGGARDSSGGGSGDAGAMLGVVGVLESLLGVDLDAHDLDDFAAAIDLVAGQVLDAGGEASVVAAARELLEGSVFAGPSVAGYAEALGALLAVPLNLAAFGHGEVGVRVRVALAGGGSGQFGTLVSALALPAARLCARMIREAGPGRDGSADARRWSRVASAALKLLCLATWRVRPEGPTPTKIRRSNPTPALAAAAECALRESGEWNPALAAGLIALNANVEGAPPPPAALRDPSAMSIRALKTVLADAGADLRGVVEKSELVRMVREKSSEKSSEIDAFADGGGGGGGGGAAERAEEVASALGALARLASPGQRSDVIARLASPALMVSRDSAAYRALVTPAWDSDADVLIQEAAEGGRGGLGGSAAVSSAPDSNRGGESAASVTAPPDDILCALTKSVITHAVRSPQGKVFDRAAIEAAIEENGGTCPITGAPLAKDDLVPDGEIQDRIVAYNIRVALELNRDQDLYDF